MSYSCLEELQVDLDLHALNKTDVLSKAGRQCNEGWFIVTNDGKCHLFDKNGNLDDIRKIKCLNERHIRKNIIKIIIPNSVISIGDDAFYGCDRLMSMMIPDSVTSIGESAFDSCYSLTNAMIPNSVTSIESSVFYHCSRLMSVTIPDGVTCVGRMMFSDCKSLISVTIPDSVTSIGDWAFEDCRNLTCVTIGNSVTNFGAYVFSGCSKLTSLIFKGKTLEQVMKMKNYPWGIDESIIKVK